MEEVKGCREGSMEEVDIFSSNSGERRGAKIVFFLLLLRPPLLFRPLLSLSSFSSSFQKAALTHKN